MNINDKNELVEDIEQLKEEIEWINRKIYQITFSQEELDREERALSTRLQIMEIDLEDAIQALAELDAQSAN